MPVVRIVSEDSRPWNLRFQQENVVIPAMGQAHVEWEKACFWLGDPGTLQERRRDEFNRKRTWYGFQEGFHTDADWEQLRPKLLVFDQATNERIYMVLDDPAGNVSNTVTTPVYDPQSRIAELEAKIEFLMAQQGNRPAEVVAPADATSGVAGFQFTDPDGNPIADALPGGADAVPSADPSTAGALADTPGQVPTGRKAR